MADFVAVLRKTIGTLGDNTPEMREKVFEKARAAIESKLAAIQPPPPKAVADRQRMALEDAIAAVKAEYGEESLADDEDDFEGAFARHMDGEDSSVAATMAPGSVGAPGGPDFVADPDRAEDEDDDPALGAPLAGASAPRPRQAARRSGRGRPGLLAAALALVVIGGASYAVWLNKDDFANLLGASGPTVVTEAEQTAAEEIAAQDEVTETVAAEESAPAEAPVQEKFTQRLLPDGSEVDEGPAAEERRIGEGTSVTAVSPGTEPESAEGTQTAEGGQQQSTPAQVPVGQRAIFYEERTSAAEGSAQTGSIVWSLVQESPGANEPPEPAIRAEATIPAHNLQLRMTIRRNADQTLPASHIIEMIFLTPDNFSGGAIDNVLRIAMKETEGATGNPLLGIPAKIADGFFLVALSDQPAETETNLSLLRRQDWIDVPVVYRSGRRALMTLEKGIPGDRVFEEALQAWQEATSG